MEELVESVTEPTTEEAQIVDVNDSSETIVVFSASISFFDKVTYVDKRQDNGRWAPAFPEASLEKQEAYVNRMIRRDKELNLG